MRLRQDSTTAHARTPPVPNAIDAAGVGKAGPCWEEEGEIGHDRVSAESQTECRYHPRPAPFSDPPRQSLQHACSFVPIVVEKSEE